MYRFVHADSLQDPYLPMDFVSDLEAGKSPFRREKAYPELREGLSMFGSATAARAQWEAIRAAAEKRGQEIRAGHYIAEVVLEPGLGFEIEDLREPDEHLTIWGDCVQLAMSVRRIDPAWSQDG